MREACGENRCRLCAAHGSQLTTQQSILRAGCLSLVPMVLHMQLRGLFGVMGRVNMMAVGRVRVVRCQLVVACFVMLGGLAMMAGGVFMMFSCFVMVLSGLFGHVSSPYSICQTWGWNWHRVDCARVDYSGVRAI